MSSTFTWCPTSSILRLSCLGKYHGRSLYAKTIARLSDTIHVYFSLYSFNKRLEVTGDPLLLPEGLEINRNFLVTALLAGLSLGHLGKYFTCVHSASVRLRVLLSSKSHHLELLAFFHHLVFLPSIGCRFQLPTVPAVANLTTIGTIALGLGAATDILTAGALCFFLKKLRIGGYRSSDKLVDNLMRYAVSTGVVTRWALCSSSSSTGELGLTNHSLALNSMVSIAVVLLFNLMPHNLVFVGVFFVLSKCYAISFMATMNTRRCIRGRGTDRNGSTDPTHSVTRSTNLQLNSRVPETPVNESSLGFWRSETDLSHKNYTQGSLQADPSREFVQYLPTIKEPTAVYEIDDYYYRSQPRAI
ncbi:hypothetical protein D9758_006487 [Tetrapyrgos nigripes]|uniref:DUF6534 domain-containing protein n=1 Tax=Tetrapyrgos nigripes TaxID=182062 RepID=A0A8H5GL89_9AGAR|nr:hypothetical protein D9758_006487 [Tetrapyrgos nigripes]